MSVPVGFQPMAFNAEGLIGLLGPYHWRQDGDAYVYGFQSDTRHGNPNGVIHGGALTAFADTMTGHVIEHSCGRKCATIALDSRFVAAGKVGAWVEGRARLRKLTKTLAFLDVDLSADGELILTASCVYRVFALDAGHGRG
ncbi:MAG: PaaI family thioesterase [Rhodoblastus sp.]|jgi:uncharacterized protein (TIGR00369 family)